MVEASRVVTLPPEAQKEFTARLVKGERERGVLASFFPPRPAGHVKVGDAVAAFMRMLEHFQSVPCGKTSVNQLHSRVTPQGTD